MATTGWDSPPYHSRRFETLFVYINQAGAASLWPLATLAGATLHYIDIRKPEMSMKGMRGSIISTD